jgi:cell division protein FtsZ
MAPLNINLSKKKEYQALSPKILVFGIGGAGGNAVNNMIRSNLKGIEFIAANTDAQSLLLSEAGKKIQLGMNATKGLGAGSYPEIGKTAAEEAFDEIENLIEDAHMIFITAGMGGGTGTGAAPVIAKMAKERDILTIAVVTKPFDFEGKYRMATANDGIKELRKYVDTLIIVPNQNLFRVANIKTTVENAFQIADNVLHAGVRGITDLITMPGLINLDFADVKTIMKKMGKAMMGTGEADGENRAIKAVEEALSNPLLDDISIKGAKGAIVNITGSPDITLFEFDEAAKRIKEEMNSDANIIIGTAFNKDLKGIKVSIFATGIEDNEGLNLFGAEGLKADNLTSNQQAEEEIEENDNYSFFQKQEPEIEEKEEDFFDTGISVKISDLDDEDETKNHNSDKSVKLKKEKKSKGLFGFFKSNNKKRKMI